MKIVSFNINSIRARLHQIEHLRDSIDPDVIGLQETKVNDPDFPIESINNIGYHVEYHGQKGHYGVAILSKIKPFRQSRVLKMIQKMIKKDLYNQHLSSLIMNWLL